ncbi:MAG: hypothetical protein GKR93_06860 [Gammaproteobacteria bacterium]|nr:hypothetical protein [Gammaproteobacteria bacterium]
MYSLLATNQQARDKQNSPCLLSAYWLLAVLLIPASGYADLGDLKVYSPIVEKGELAFEVLGDTTFDNDKSRDGFQYHEFEFEYSINDRWATSLTNSIVKLPGEDLKYNVLGWENTIQFTEEGKYWLDTGVHIELELDDEKDVADQVEVRFLFRHNSGKFEHIANINFEQQFGSAAEESLELEYIWRSKYRLSDTSGIGLEAYGELGEIKKFESLPEQEHILGPAVYHDLVIFGIGLETQMTWLFGLTQGSVANTFRWQLEFDF